MGSCQRGNETGNVKGKIDGVMSKGIWDKSCQRGNGGDHVKVKTG